MHKIHVIEVPDLAGVKRTANSIPDHPHGDPIDFPWNDKDKPTIEEVLETYDMVLVAIPLFFDHDYEIYCFAVPASSGEDE